MLYVFFKKLRLNILVLEYFPVPTTYKLILCFYLAFWMLLVLVVDGEGYGGKLQMAYITIYNLTNKNGFMHHNLQPNKQKWMHASQFTTLSTKIIACNTIYNLINKNGCNHHNLQHKQKWLQSINQSIFMLELKTFFAWLSQNFFIILSQFTT